VVEGKRHYFNLLPNLELLDATKKQFIPEFDPNHIGNLEFVERRQLLNSKQTRERYHILKDRVKNSIVIKF
jgi:hypothetical protein